MDTITDAPTIAIVTGMATVIPVCIRSTVSGSIVKCFVSKILTCTLSIVKYTRLKSCASFGGKHNR